MTLKSLLRQADHLRAGRIHWDEAPTGWMCRCSGIDTPHKAYGRTPIEALGDLLRFLRIARR
jgi:hypothetical protein